jgi:ABC-2 type transport system permease protein
VTAAIAEAPVVRRPVSVNRGYRFELVKLFAQWRVRLLIVACWIGPAVFVAVVSQQSSLPTDTVFGRSMHATGWAGPLVVLGFSGSWALPLLTAVVAGDVFATEDRLGTWRQLLVAVRSIRRIFVAKALASLTVIGVMVAGLASSGVVAGVVVVGHLPLVGLDGHLIDAGEAGRLVALSWAGAVAPTLAFAAVGLLGSVAMGRSPMGLVLPALLACAMQIAELMPLPVALRMSLPGHAFLAWRGLYTSPAQLGPLLVAIAVSLTWAVLATVLAYALFVRRDFTDVAYDGSGRRLLTAGLLPLAALVAVTTVIVGISAPTAGSGRGVLTGSGIDRSKLEASLATSYAHLYRLQADQLSRPDVTEAQLAATAACDKGGRRVVDVGPGHDWRCVVSWHLPGVDRVGTAIYQLDVTPDGRYIADGDGPKEVNGYFQVRTRTGDAPNPLWQFDGNVDLLAKAGG